MADPDMMNGRSEYSTSDLPITNTGSRFRLAARSLIDDPPPRPSLSYWVAIYRSNTVLSSNLLCVQYIVAKKIDPWIASASINNWRPGNA